MASTTTPTQQQTNSLSLSNTKDACAWDAWEEFCGVMNTAPLRQASFVREYPARESKLLGLFFVLWIYPRLKPRSRADRWAKPRSALAYRAVGDGHLLDVANGKDLGAVLHGEEHRNCGEKEKRER